MDVVVAAGGFWADAAAAYLAAAAGLRSCAVRELEAARVAEGGPDQCPGCPPGEGGGIPPRYGEEEDEA